MDIKYSLIPYKRDQDRIHIGRIKNRDNIEIEFASIVDGWNDEEKMPGDIYGRDVAELVSRRFPEMFISKISSSDLEVDKIKKIAKQSEIFINNLTKIIKERKNRQKDDISILLF